MIGSIRGQLVAKSPPLLLIDVQGIGYEVEAPMTTIYKLPGLGEEVRLFTHHLVREDAQLLYGFYSLDERQLFRDLIKVNGIGAKLALAILSGMEAGEFAQCVFAGDALRLTKLPGVGKKTAERLIVEMRDKLSQLEPAGNAARATAIHQSSQDPAADAVSGLIALGYRPQEASRFVHGIDCEGLRSEEIIREVLKGLVKA